MSDNVVAAIAVTVGLAVSLSGVCPVPALAVQDVLPTIVPVAVARPLPVMPRPFFEGPFSYGRSFGGRSLLAYRFGTGPSVRIIVGGIHGGY